MADYGTKVMRRPAEVEGRPWQVGDSFVIKHRSVGPSSSPIYRVISVDEETNTMEVEWDRPGVVFYNPARDFSGAMSGQEGPQSDS